MTFAMEENTVKSYRSIRFYFKGSQLLMLKWTCTLEEHEANTLIIGWNRNIKKGGIKNDALKRKKRRRINRTFTSFPLSRLISMIKSTARKKGISVVTTEESYTSVACFYDGDMPEKGVEFSGTRLTHSLYKTREGRMGNADINASLNIYKKM